MISIIIPFYNVDSVISRCLNSILNQTFVDFEVICINDGSTDYSVQYVTEYKKCDERIRLISIPHSGPGYARNLGISLSKGDYILFCDADDFIDKNMLAKMVINIENNKSDIVCCDFMELCGSLDIKHCLEGDSEFEMFFHEVAIWNKLYRRDFLVKNCVGFPIAYRGEDRVFLAYCYSKKPIISYEKGFYYHWIKEETNKNSLNKIVSYEDLVERISNWEQFLVILDENYREVALQNVYEGKIYLESLCQHIPDSKEKMSAVNLVADFYKKHFG